MPTFGDRVRIRTTSETEAAGVAGQIGMIMGFTTPSLGYVSDAILGAVIDDTAVAVTLEGEATSRWFSTDLIEFVDHAPDTTIRVGDVEMRRDVDGSWTKLD
jgi:hypothetical protein